MNRYYAFREWFYSRPRPLQWVLGPLVFLAGLIYFVAVQVAIGVLDVWSNITTRLTILVRRRKVDQAAVNRLLGDRR